MGYQWIPTAKIKLDRFIGGLGGEKGKGKSQESRRENGKGRRRLVGSSSTRQPGRVHSSETKRNDLPVGLNPQPTSDPWLYAYLWLPMVPTQDTSKCLCLSMAIHAYSATFIDIYKYLRKSIDIKGYPEICINGKLCF